MQEGGCVGWDPFAVGVGGSKPVLACLVALSCPVLASHARTYTQPPPLPQPALPQGYSSICTVISTPLASSVLCPRTHTKPVYTCIKTAYIQVYIKRTLQPTNSLIPNVTQCNYVTFKCLLYPP